MDDDAMHNHSVYDCCLAQRWALSEGIAKVGHKGAGVAQFPLQNDVTCSLANQEDRCGVHE
jgi:hypothetical protein